MFIRSARCNEQHRCKSISMDISSVAKLADGCTHHLERWARPNDGSYLSTSQNYTTSMLLIKLPKLILARMYTLSCLCCRDNVLVSHATFLMILIPLTVDGYDAITTIFTHYNFIRISFERINFYDQPQSRSSQMISHQDSVYPIRLVGTLHQMTLYKPIQPPSLTCLAIVS